MRVLHQRALRRLSVPEKELVHGLDCQSIPDVGVNICCHKRGTLSCTVLMPSRQWLLTCLHPARLG